jgi:hypothetical protein
MANRPPEGRVSVHVSYTDETEVKNGRGRRCSVLAYTEGHRG